MASLNNILRWRTIIKVSDIIIRKAICSDALNIHVAHMKSIQEVCSIDHSIDEISAWGNRPFNKEQRIHAINNHFVYVIELENKIEGFLHFTISENKKESYVFGLYLTKKINGIGIGKSLVNIMFDELKRNSVQKINLHSSITAHPFYLKLGFMDSSLMTTVSINQTPIRCIPMEKYIH